MAGGKIAVITHKMNGRLRNSNFLFHGPHSAMVHSVEKLQCRQRSCAADALRHENLVEIVLICSVRGMFCVYQDRRIEFNSNMTLAHLIHTVDFFYSFIFGFALHFKWHLNPCPVQPWVPCTCPPANFSLQSCPESVSPTWKHWVAMIFVRTLNMSTHMCLHSQDFT